MSSPWDVVEFIFWMGAVICLGIWIAIKEDE